MTAAARPLTLAEALDHPWWGEACPACGAPPGRPCAGTAKPRPNKAGCCQHTVGAGAPYCCLHGQRTRGHKPGYVDPRSAPAPPVGLGMSCRTVFGSIGSPGAQDIV